MAKSVKFVFSGEAYWCRCFEGQEDSYDSGPEYYKITLAMDEESWQKYKSSKIKLKSHPVSQDEPEKLSITFRRAKEPRVFDDGNTLGGGTPKVLDADGKPWDTSKAIGNGSKVQVLVDRYIPKDKPSMVGHRLEAVKVLKHVPYDADPFAADFSVEPEEEDIPVKEEKPKKVEKKPSKIAQDMDDDIPF